MGVRPHDLLRLACPDALIAVDAPGWVGGSLAAAPWVVVRRMGEVGARIAVGVRGANRSERFAAFVARRTVAERLSPEALRDRKPPRRHPAFETMDALRPALDACGLAWGPAGAAGYELATGRWALTEASDLDLVLRGDRPDLRGLQALLSAAARMPVAVDLLLETACGAVAARDLLGGDEQVLLRAAEGPRLMARRDLLAPSC